MKKGQTATEYLIIFAVVIIISLIVVGVMGGIPGIKKPDTKVEKLTLLCDSYGMKYSGVAGNVLTCNQHKEMAHYNISSPVTFTYDEAWLRDATNATIENITAS
jgi:hypothetical protein